MTFKVGSLNQTYQSIAKEPAQPGGGQDENHTQERCSSNPDPVFSHHITDIEKVENIVTPLVIVAGT